MCPRKGIPKCLSSAYAQCATRVKRAEEQVKMHASDLAVIAAIDCNLPNRVEKAEESLQDDGEVSKLEDECNWFRGETNRLLANRATMTKDIKVDMLYLC